MLSSCKVIFLSVDVLRRFFFFILKYVYLLFRLSPIIVFKTHGHLLGV